LALFSRELHIRVELPPEEQAKKPASH